MDNIFIIAGIISVIFLIAKFIEMRFVEKENKPLKLLIRDALLVYFSVVSGYFILEQINPMIQTGGATTTPVFNEKKSRLEPNFSFDLCRLACSIYDYVIEDFEDVKYLETCDPIKRLVFEWCLDDKGINMLYKNNGVDRYPDFKLYKMIARCVHKHTPQAQLDRQEFKAFSNFKGEVPNDFIDIDKIPVYTN